MYMCYYPVTPLYRTLSAPYIILPTTFLSDARRLYCIQPRQCSTEIKMIHNQIQKTEIETVTIPSIYNNHFVGYVYQPQECTIEHADSLGGSPDPDVLNILKWLFSDLMESPISQIKSVTVWLQGGEHSGAGSCGLATLTFLECTINPSIQIWHGAVSHVFWRSALEDLVLYHFISCRNSQSFHDWTVKKSTSVEPLLFEERPCGYNDFNMYIPLVRFIIVCFLDQYTYAYAYCLQNRTRLPVGE